jgi:hypothetical protein
VARIDKIPPGSSFRAKLAVAWPSSDKGKVYGVGLNASGKVVKGAGATGILGIYCPNGALAADEVIDVMKAGSELADFNFLNDGTTATIAATKYYGIPADGLITATSAGNTLIGHTVEKDGFNRLVIDAKLA